MDQSYHIQHQILVREKPAQNGLSRRQSLKWLGVLSAGLTLPLISGCETVAIRESSWGALKALYIPEESSQ